MIGDNDGNDDSDEVDHAW